MSSSNPNGIKWISGEMIRETITWEALIPSVAGALLSQSLGPHHERGSKQPLRTTITVPENNGMMMVMPGYEGTSKALATKVLSLFPSNKNLGVSTHNAIVILLDHATGFPLALLDGIPITEYRTAAASVVATQLLVSEKGKTNGVIAILGAGVQARAHARVMNLIFKPRLIRIWSRRKESSEALVKDLIAEGIPCSSCGQIEETVRDADVINTCTLAQEPILLDEWVKDGAHINSVGAPRPDWQELAPELVNRCIVYADSRESAIKESGDIIKSKADVFGEIGEVINGTKPAHRNKTTMFKSLGLAVEDAVTAKLIYDSLKEK